LESHPQFRTHTVKQRVSPHITCFIGPSFPRKDIESHEESYGQHVLLFFKPWRKLSDLWGDPPTVSWKQLLADWFASPEACPGWVHRMLRNIQSLHEGEDKRKQLRDENKSSRLNVIATSDGPLQGEGTTDGFDDPLEDQDQRHLERDRDVSWYFFYY
jgi:hypothetical protein